MDREELKKIREMRYVLQILNEKNNGNWKGTFEDIKNKVFVQHEEVIRKENENEAFISLIDEEYPSSLKEINQPPFVIYYNGNIELLDKNNILGILNDNIASSYAMDTIERICDEVKNKCIFAISFGTVKNNDLIKKLINKGAKVIAVLSKGLKAFDGYENELLNEIAKENLVITQFPASFNQKTKAQDVENAKLVVGVSNAVLVGGIIKNSPQTLGASIAIQENVAVLCIPFNAESNYVNNGLIKAGAFLVENGNDVLTIMKIEEE